MCEGRVGRPRFSHSCTRARSGKLLILLDIKIQINGKFTVFNPSLRGAKRRSNPVARLLGCFASLAMTKGSVTKSRPVKG